VLPLLRYMLNRTLNSLFVLLAIITITFLLMHAIPGGRTVGFDAANRRFQPGDGNTSSGLAIGYQ